MYTLTRIPTGKIISADCETTGLFPRQGHRPFCISFANLQGQTATSFFEVNPFSRIVCYRKKELKIMREFFSNPEQIVVAHNAQFDKRMIEAMLEMETKVQWRCTMALIRVVQSNARLALKPFCKENFNFPDDDEKELRSALIQARHQAKLKGWSIANAVEPDYWLVPDLCVKYNIQDVLRVVVVWTNLIPEIKKLGLENVWMREKRLWPLLRKIEDHGVHIDKDKVLEMKESFKKKLQLYTLKARIMAGPINLNSSLQLRKKLYDDLRMPVKYLTKKAKVPATDYSALYAMKHPLPQALIEMRSCAMTVNFFDQYLKFMVQRPNGRWYIHPEFSQCIPTTGRESNYAPCLQQASSGENGKIVEVKPEVRRPFCPPPKCQWRSYDWKNIEVFIPAFKSGEKELIKVLMAGGDVHQNTADGIIVDGKAIERITAKRVFFGLQYGIGINKLAKQLGVEYEVAEEIMWKFGNKYSALVEWMETLKARASADGYVTTPYGRRQHVDRGFEYRAINYYIQGTAADILKDAKLKINQQIAKRGLGVNIILPVHDEILPEIKDGVDLDEVDDVFVSCMQDNPELKMPINIPVSISAIKTNWHDKVKVRLAS